MEARAIAKYVRISDRKVSKYGRAVKDLPYREAITALNIHTAHGARVLHGVIRSAVSNLMAKSKNIDEESIRIDEIKVNQGPTLKRWKPRARGRADRINKRTCHVSVVVSGEEIQK